VGNSELFSRSIPRRILFVSKGAESASTRYRASQFFSRLEQANFIPSHAEIRGGPLAYLGVLKMAASADIVVILRKTFPVLFLSLLRKVSRRLVFDFDDAIFCNSNGSSSATRMRRFVAMVRCCDHVIAGNGFLGNMARRFNSELSIIPTSVDVDHYKVGKGVPSAYFDVVWIGSSSTRKYLEAAIPSLSAAARRIPALRLKIIADFDLDSPGFPTVSVRWQAATEAAELASANVGIAPMSEDDWSRGKCALKVLQYMAVGLPVISSPVGVNAEAVLEGKTGYLVSGNEWVTALQKLASDPELAYQMGQAGYQRVTALYSSEVVGARLLRVLESVAGVE